MYESSKLVNTSVFPTTTYLKSSSLDSSSYVQELTKVVVVKENGLIMAETVVPHTKEASMRRAQTDQSTKAVLLL